MITVRDLLKMKKDNGIWAVNPDTTTLDAVRFMASRNIGALMVLEDGILSGIVSERDLVYRIAEQHALDVTTPIKEYMTSPVFTVTPDQTIEECMQIMSNRRIRHLPVMMENDALIGLISIGDVVRALIEDHERTINHLQDYITGGGYGKY
jgi:CBS domain-containing protein